MDVILKKDIKKVGNAGEAVDVKDGYARNYLIPRGMALKNTPQNRKAWENEVTLTKQKESKEIKLSEKLVKKLESISCTINMKAGENDRLFGSVTSADIAEALKTQGVEVDKKHIALDEPIKELGVYTVDVKVHAGITGKIKVWVVKE